MKKSLLTIAVIGTFAGAAQAQSSINTYGVMDIGLIKSSEGTLALGRGDNNRLGFRGEEDLGGGLKAHFRIEMRFEPDTGTTESRGRRPLFQGRTVVGLKGSWGTLKLGRDLTAVQGPIGDFDPFMFQTVGSLFAITGNYSSDPSYPGSSGNRFSNGIYYNTPEFDGLQGGLTVATKEAVGNFTGQLREHPVSAALTYFKGPAAAMIGWERGTASDKFWTVAASYDFKPLKVIGAYSQHKPFGGVDEKNWLVGGDYAVSTGSIKFGYGQIKPDNASADKQVSIGYWHNLSKRTMLYTDATQHRPGRGDNYSVVDLGIRHSF